MTETGTAPRAARRATGWLPARLVDAWWETQRARTLVLDVPGWSGHLAGQHVDVKLTAEDGYSAQRSYSVASTSRAGRLELTVQRVLRGEVSSYLVDVMEPGDALELRGPVGGWFVWSPPGDGPVLLVAGGSGVVPLMSMLRARGAARDRTPFRLVYSVRSPDHVFYAHELHELSSADPALDVRVVHTRSAPPLDPRGSGRVTAADLEAAPEARAFVCGPTGFVEAVATLLVGLGHDPSTIRTERFGPTGGADE
ncbi:ferredoxin reductase [Nocardioides sp. GXQ0305]|uniref:ferredoxin reductase n=1 Tax=Nocardioides sp. GXQ0305 TaxID=3423912 RepID=UPI003D7D2ED8